MALGRTLAVRTTFVCAVMAFSGVSARTELEQTQTTDGHALLALTQAWGLGSTRPVFIVKGSRSELDEARERRALIVAILGDGVPARRNISAGEPFLQIADAQLGAEPTSGSLEDLLPVAAINTGARWIEAARARPLTSFRLGVARLRQGSGESALGPFAVWDVSSGEILLDQQLVDGIAGLSARTRSFVDSFAKALLHRISKFVPSSADGTQKGADLGGLYLKAARTAIVVAFAAKIPVWFCIACPVALGLLAPFLFNAGLGGAAEMICEHYRLPSEECNDLWYGAFGLALILSLASVLPIVYVCQLSKCARQG